MSVQTLSYPRVKSLRFKSEQMLGCGAIAIYIALLMWVYRVAIAPKFAYMRLDFNPPSSNWVIVLTLFLAFVPSLWMPLTIRRPSELLYDLLYIFAYLPSILVPPFALQLANSDLVLFELYLFGSLSILRLAQFVKTPNVQGSRIGATYFWPAVIIVSLFNYLLIAYATKLKFDGFQAFLAGGNEYDIRSSYKAVALEGAALLGYVVGIQQGAINPLLIAWGLVKRNYLLIFLGFAGQFFLFALTGFKAVFLSGFLLTFIILLFKFSKRVGLALITFSTALVVVCYALDIFTHSIVFTSVFVRRLSLLPGLLCGMYFEYFSSVPKLFLGNGMLRGVFGATANYTPASAIAITYFGKPGMSANANFWGDAFAQFGFGGIVGYSVLLALIFIYVDAIGARKDVYVCSLMLAAPAFSLANTALLTNIATHGLGAALLLMYFLPSTGKAVQPKKKSKDEEQDFEPDRSDSASD